MCSRTSFAKDVTRTARLAQEKQTSVPVARVTKDLISVKRSASMLAEQILKSTTKRLTLALTATLLVQLVQDRLGSVLLARKV